MTPPVTPETVRVLLIDDHTLFREGLSRLLDGEPGFQMAAHCGTVEEGLRILASTPVDVVLLDYDLGGSPASEFIPSARGLGFQGRTLILTAGVSEAVATGLLAQGACGIFLKHRSPKSLLECLRRVAAGETWIDDPKLTAAPKPAPMRPPKRLTRREREVLRLVFEGLGNKEIAGGLSISEAAVKSALQQLFRKTGMRNRSGLVRAAMRMYVEDL